VSLAGVEQRVPADESAFPAFVAAADCSALTVLR